MKCLVPLSRDRNGAGNGDDAVSEVSLFLLDDVAVLFPPFGQHVDRHVAAATQHDDDLVIRAHPAAQRALQLAVVAEGDVDAARHLDHDALIVCEPPAAHGSFRIRQHDGAHVGAHGVVEGALGNTDAAKASGLGGDFGESDKLAGLDGGGEGGSAIRLGGKDSGRFRHAQVVESHADAVEQAAATYRADDDVWGSAAGHLSGELVHDGGVAFPDIWVVEGGSVDGGIAGLEGGREGELLIDGCWCEGFFTLTMTSFLKKVSASFHVAPCCKTS